MWIRRSTLIAAVLLTVTIAVDPPYPIPGPTRTPFADREADKAHHRALRAWDRKRQKYFRYIARNGIPPPIASTAPIPSDIPPTPLTTTPLPDVSATVGATPTMDPRAFDRLKHKKMRELDREYQAALRAWDRRRQKAYRNGVVTFTEVKPPKPDIEQLAIEYLTEPSPSPNAPVISPAVRMLDW